MRQVSFLAVRLCLCGVQVASEEGEGKDSAINTQRRLRIPGA